MIDIDKETLKRELYVYCFGEEYADGLPPDLEMEPEVKEVIDAFESVDYDARLFLSQKAYNMIEDEHNRYIFLLMFLMPHTSPINEYRVDAVNGYLDFYKREEDFTLPGEDHPLTDLEIMTYMMQCDSDEEIWELMMYGVGDIDRLCKWYMGVNPSPEIDDEYVTCYCEKDLDRLYRFLAYMRRHDGSHKGLTFELEGEEYERYCSFLNRHIHPETGCYLGESRSFIFIPTSIGTIATIRCNICGEEETLTNLDTL
ncbi:MAG: hypothetical protein HUK03_05795 [Bacteroidaceae bacterium]|nr:hypothetical protein [Bacteroidaceae bacterium]